MLLYYSQTVSAIATATCDLRAVALLRCAVALLLFEAITKTSTVGAARGDDQSETEICSEFCKNCSQPPLSLGHTLTCPNSPHFPSFVAFENTD